jgi:cytochrome c553
MKNITLLSLAAASLLFTACGEKTKEAANDAATAVTEAVKVDTSSAVDAVKEAAADAAEATKAKAAEIAETAKVEAQKVADAAAAKATELKEAAEKKATDAAAALKERAAAATVAVTEAVAPVNEAGQAAYAKCAGCHGADGKTKALGKSAVVAGQPVAALVEAINGYKAGTRNVSGMGMLMKGQVASMDEATIKAVADYIAAMK